MSRIITDADLNSWEAYPSGGPFGFPDKPKIIFRCLSSPDTRSRVIVLQGDSADAERLMSGAEDARLLDMLTNATDLR